MYVGSVCYKSHMPLLEGPSMPAEESIQLWGLNWMKWMKNMFIEMELLLKVSE